MSEVRSAYYEAMFLFPQSATADLQGCVDHVTDILTKHGGEIVALRKWDERRLAYDIAGNKRGLYLLAYFHAKTTALAAIERDCNLSERLLRAMVVKADHMTREQMEALEGRQQLADEINLRSTSPAGAVVAEEPEEETVPADDDSD
ncbi:MAG: 30S ribosomal protein S6 [Phycisphaerales bacterium]|nr:30S ribosomal protein S6 [Phycisphaerales bacterium]